MLEAHFLQQETFTLAVPDEGKPIRRKEIVSLQ